ncbi:hypothetical protein ACH4HG_38840 [Streptomyces coeruleorubidus]|uniref:hypothetical protein n=1 Tax=Streptomyces coeruleorubidus TaxID=116188 RepID=UPI0019B76ECF|nr:hypothetical protein [Streptomyces bellus]GGT94274.1 hypothetical protein GCM10010244_19570 [Streptomyces bellus]
MTHIRASISAFARPRRALAAAALASLALTGCGSEVKGSGPQGGPVGSVASKARPTQPSPEQEAFAAMLEMYAQMCPPSDGVPPAPPGKSAGPEPVRSLAPGETPPTDPIEPGPPTGPAAELDRHDGCTSVHHEQRIIEALQKVAEPTPAKVRKTLNGLGYIDERIHGLKQDGKTTRFYLDLRENGGRLCEAGRAAGETTDVTACVAHATGPFTVKTEEQP